MRRVIALIVCLCMIIGVFPATASATAAGAMQFVNSTDNPTGGILSCTDASITWASPKYHYIYYGTSDLINPTSDIAVKWRVLDDKTNTGALGLFLLSDNLLETTSFAAGSNVWNGSTAQNWCIGFVNSNLTATEAVAIMPTSKTDSEDYVILVDNAGNPIDQNLSFGAVTLSDEKMFFLSPEEAAKREYGLAGPANKMVTDATGNGGSWWLRTPGIGATTVLDITNSGTWTESECGNTAIYARPAFNLDMDKVLFTSAAEGGKLCGPAGAPTLTSSALTEVASAVPTSWKLTLKDDSLNGLTASAAAISSTEVAITYAGAVTGSDNYLSVIIKDDSGNITHYGRVKQIKNSSDAEGEATLILPSEISVTDKILVFTEKYHGDRMTDYVGNLVSLSNLTVDLNGGNGATTSGYYTSGENIDINAGTKSHYRFREWTTSGGGIFTDAGSASTFFSMPANAAAISANWNHISSGNNYFSLTFETNGGQKIATYSAISGSTVNLTQAQYIPVRQDYEFTGWYLDKGLTNKISTIKLTANMTVYAGWSEINPFVDVNEEDWFYDEVMFVYHKGLMNGVYSNLFVPNGTTNRAMAATILWRMEGSPGVSGTSGFIDVIDGQYYTDAVTWTKETGIVKGYSDTYFGWNLPVTREELAAIFYRYEQYKGYDTTILGDFSSFADKDSVAIWAQDAMRWSVGAEIIKGNPDNLICPQHSATRAELATMLQRIVLRNTPLSES